MYMNKKTTGLAAGRPSVNKQNLSMADQPVLVRINAQVSEADHQKLKIHAHEEVLDLLVLKQVPFFCQKLQYCPIHIQ